MNTIYHLAFLLLFQFPFSVEKAPQSTLTASLSAKQQSLKKEKSGSANLVFRSTDGGQTWQDISKGLPLPLQDDYGFGSNDYFTDANGLHLTTGKGMYHSQPNATISYWKKEDLPYQHKNITPGKNGIYTYNYQGGIFFKKNGTSVWLPVFSNFKEKEIGNIFETAEGTIFISTNSSVFKSTDEGKTWKNLHVDGSNFAATNGVIIATNQKGIIRSTDGGETWALVIEEGGVGIAVESIEGGFAAITYNSTTKSRRIRTSYDGGKTWQAIDAGLPPDDSIACITQMGKFFFCGHPKGIYRSADNGKTWKLLLPSINNKVFNVSASGKVMYAILKDIGC
jgi:hypothetical protein